MKNNKNDQYDGDIIDIIDLQPKFSGRRQRVTGKLYRPGYEPPIARPKPQPLEEGRCPACRGALCEHCGECHSPVCRLKRIICAGAQEALTHRDVVPPDGPPASAAPKEKRSFWKRIF